MLAAALLPGADVAVAQAGIPSPQFTWSVPERMKQGTGPGSVGEYDTQPREVRAGPWPVNFRVLPPACSGGAKYSWSVDGEAAGPPSSDCRFEHRFPREGAYKVGLEVSGPHGVTSSSSTVVVQDWLIVSLGDSVASGEGNPDVARKRGALWADRRCHRSSMAGTAQAALALERGDPKTSVTFVHLACSGETIRTGLIASPDAEKRSRAKRELPPQVDELARIAAVRPPDAVLLSIGANDIHFGPMSIFCILVRNCPKRRFNPLHPFRRPSFNRGSELLSKVEKKALAQLPARYGELNTYMNEAYQRENVPPKDRPPVYIVEYFDPTIGPHGWCRILGISPGEAKWAHRQVLAPLDRKVAAAANRYSWTLVPGVAEAFRGHGYCAKGNQRWIRTLGESSRLHGLSKPGMATAGTLHPNERGHLATAALIAGVLGPGLRASGSITARPDPHVSDNDEVIEPWALLGITWAGLLGAGIFARRRHGG